MCDCEYCVKVSNIQRTINVYQSVAARLNGLESKLSSLENDINRTKLSVDVFMKTDRMPEIKNELELLDGDMKNIKNSVLTRVNQRLSGLCADKANAEAEAAQYHEEERRRQQELEMAGNLNGKG